MLPDALDEPTSKNDVLSTISIDFAGYSCTTQLSPRKHTDPDARDDIVIKYAVFGVDVYAPAFMLHSVPR